MKYPTIKNLRGFIAVSELNSFARAAERLNLSQPALSETINQLEKLLGGKLIHRTTRSMQLTPMGEFLLPRAQNLVNELERLLSDLEDITDLKRGRVDLGCLASIAYQYLPRIIAKFQEHHPNVVLNIRDDHAAGLFRLLTSREIEFAVTSPIARPSEIEFKPLLKDPYYLVCLANHPLARQKQVSWTELQAFPYLGWARGTASRFAIDAGLNAESVTLKTAFELSQLGTMLGMVDMGLGVASVPYLACPVSKKYAAIPLVMPIIRREIGLATVMDRVPTPSAQKFMALIESWMVKSEPPALGKKPAIKRRGISGS